MKTKPLANQELDQIMDEAKTGTELKKDDAVNKFTYIPSVDTNYVPWGNSEKIEKIIKSGKYYPTFITGPAGNGKTTSVEQVCAKLGREFVRVNFTNETGEDDLIGSLSLISKDGVTITSFNEGPIVHALRRGAVLLLDEVDCGNPNRILCLQSVLEGRGVLIKSTGEFVKPEKGFTVFATSNTQGRGSDDGRYIGANIQNAAFLDRFSAMLHQTYPPKEIELDLLNKYFMSYIPENKEYSDKFDLKSDSEQIEEVKKVKDWLEKLCVWADSIRKTFDAGGVEEVVTTRTLINCVQGFSIFEDFQEAIKMACDRFDPAIAANFIDIYDKLHNTSNYVPTEPEAPKADPDDEYISL